MEDPSGRPTAWRQWRSKLAALGIVAVVVAGTWLLAGRLRDTGNEAANGTPVRAAEIVSMSAPAGAKVAAEEGALAPDFEASLLDGSRARLSDYRGRAVVLNFWATWCGACLAEIRDLERVHQARSGQGLAVIGVNVGEDAPRAERFLRQELDTTYPSFADLNRAIARRYRVTGLPVTLFIDRDGVVRRVIAGQLNYAIFDHFARVALGERGVPGVDDPLPLRFVSPLPPEDGGATGTKEAAP